ncbi:hypothetical protein Tco_0996176 [Tanacetum coccineum]
MSAITNIRCALTQKTFDTFCTKYHIPEKVHPALPNQNDTIHERPAGKIGLYTRFFDYAKFRLPLSSFLVDVLRDPALAAANFSAQDYATLVAHPSLFRKFPEEFMCLVGLSRHYTLDRETYPLFLDKDEEDMDLFAFIQTPNPTKVKVIERERKEDKPQFLETTVGHNVPLLLVTPDRGASELEASVGKLFDKDGSGNQTKQGDSAGGGGGVIIQLTVETTDVVIEAVAPVQQKCQRKRKTVAVNAGEGEVIPTLPFITSSVSATLERETGDHTDSVTRHNLRTVGAPQRFVISSDSSHHSGANVAEAEVDSIAKSSVPVMIAVTTTTPMADPAVFVKEKTSKPSLFATVSFSAGGADPNAVYVPQWSMTNGSRLDDDRIFHEMVDEFAPQKFFAFVRGMKHDQLFTKFNVGAACQMSLSCDLRSNQFSLGISGCPDKEVNDKFDKLYAGFIEMALHLEERFYPHLLTTISSRRWLLTYGMELPISKCLITFTEYFLPRNRTQGIELAIVKCLHSPEYLSALGAAIGKAIEKGMQDGLSAGITHGKEGRTLTDVAAHNPSVEDASIEAVMNILHLEEPLANKLGLSELQPHIDQLMVPIYHSLDKVVIGATALSLALDVSNIRVWKIRESTEGTSDTVTFTADTTIALYITFVSASTIAPISIDDYEVIVRGSCFPSRSLNLYAPFSSAFVTSYGPSHFGPSFPVSSARLASLLRYTRSPGLKLVFRTFEL